jgi:hypothetical protein
MKNATPDRCAKESAWAATDAPATASTHNIEIDRDFMALSSGSGVG